MNALTDIELEQRAADGERDAFGVLYERYSARVYDFLLRMVREPAEAADLMQETFVRAMRGLKAERAGTGNFATWLFTIARNLALTRISRGKRAEALAGEGDEEDEGAYYHLDPDRLDNPEAAAQAEEMSSLVWEASLALEPKQRTLLDLHVRQGLDSAEIAGVLGVSKGNAYTMVSRLKDAFEGAVAGLVMFRAGRRNCPELNALLDASGATQLTPEVRKLIERHMKECETCQGKRRELVSATALLRALAPLPLMPKVASGIKEAALTQAQQAGPAGLAGTSAGAGSSGGHAGGVLSGPARVLHALPGPAWLPAAAAAVLVAGVAVPSAIFATRGGGGRSQSSVLAATSAAAPSAAPSVVGNVAAAEQRSAFDGAYVITLPPAGTGCGPGYSINGGALTISVPSATITTANGGAPLSGTAAESSGSIAIHVTNGQSGPGAHAVDLTGTLDASGNLAGASKNGGAYPGRQQGFSCNSPFTATRSSSGAPGSVAGPASSPTVAASSATSDEDALWAAIHAAYPGVQFVASCQGFVPTQANPSCPQAGGWPAATLATGIATIGFQGGESAVVVAFGRKADGSWGYFVTIANGGGGPPIRLPGDGLACGGAEGLNVRAEPSTSAAAVTLLPNNAAIHADRFVLVTGGTSPANPQAPGEGWYHMTSPQQGWAFGRFVVPAPAQAGGCSGWWPRGG